MKMSRILPRIQQQLEKSAVRIILSITTSKGWLIKTTDIKSAFLQGKQIEREVYLRPPKEARTPAGIVWKLKHCLYGLNDAARHFYKSVKECLERIGCTQSALDPALFYMTKQGELIGFIACHVDDFLHAGNQEFEDMVLSKLKKRFLAGTYSS